MDADFLHRSGQRAVAGRRNFGAALDFSATPALEVDVTSFRYTAPAEARVPCELRGHTAPASDLFRLAEMGWFDGKGWALDQRFEDSFRTTPAVLRR